MKVLLMHPDRDFDPDQDLPSQEASLTRDLELNTLCEIMAQGDRFLFDVARQAILSSLDTRETIFYRQEILKDCLRHPDIVRQIYSIPLRSIKNKQRRWMGIFTHHPTGILNSAGEMLSMFVVLLRDLKAIADKHAEQFESRGLQIFFTMIRQELDDDYFIVMENHLKELKFRGGVLLRAELGKGNKGTNYILCKPDRQKRNWVKRLLAGSLPTYSFTLHPRDNAGARALGELKNKGVNLVANAVAQSADHINDFFNMLRLELAFYIGCLNLHEQLVLLGEQISFPLPVPVDKRRHSFTGLYDISLALTMKQKVVSNDMEADNKDLIVVTGANQGGKSTFLRSIGLAQLMMQCGMFVPATSFSANICHGLFTHFKREEDATMESGKFDEELGRMSAIIDEIRPHALILFNESFSATNEREGSEITGQIVHALMEEHIKIIFVTHLYEFAHDFYTLKKKNVLFLRAERKSDGQRTFKLHAGKPLQTSYGIDLLKELGR